MSLPDGILMRGIDVDDDADLDAAFEVASTCELASIGWTQETPEQVSATIRGPLGLTEAHRLAFEGDRPVGLLEVELDRHGRELFLDAFALGPLRDRIEHALLEDGLRSAKRIATTDPGPLVAADMDPYEMSPDLWQVLSGAHSQDEPHIRVLESLGFRPIRRFWRMVCGLSAVTGDEPGPPRGVTRRVVDGPDDRRLLHSLYEEAFADHFGSGAHEPFDEWITRVEASPGNDPGRWWIAMLDGAPAGMCILDDSKAAFGEGYVRTLGVLAHARGNGIGRWLLQCGAADAVRRGRSAIALAVDGANTTGATALYESAGYAIRQEIDVYCYPIVDSAPSR